MGYTHGHETPAACVMRVLILLLSTVLLSACHSFRTSPVSPAPATFPGPQGASSSGPPAPDADFVDLSKQAGLRFTWGYHKPGPWTNLETVGCGCAFIDYDGDGWMDIFLVGKPRCTLYHNNHDGTFTDVSAKAGIDRAGNWIGVAVGDYGNDGHEDIYVSGYQCSMLLRNNGNGTFTDVTRKAGLEETQWGTCCGFFDADGDGRLDLLVGHYVHFGPPYPELCTSSTGVKDGCRPQVYPAEFPKLYHNNGNGTFTDMTARAGLSGSHGKDLALHFLDFDGDGKLDFYLANDEEPGDLFRNLGHGRFQNVGVQLGAALDTDGAPPAGMGVDSADYDRDGKMDLIVSAFEGETFSLYHNDGEQLSVTSSPAGLGITRQFMGWGCKFVDFNDDGWPDLVFANGHIYNNAEVADPGSTFRQKPLLFRNEHGHFALVPNPGPGFTSAIVGRGLAVGDVENDGSQDLLIVDYDGHPLLLHNRRRSHNHWLGVKLRGTNCNRDGYGARVRVSWAGGSAFADYAPCGSYCSSMDPRLHFGLGAADRISQVQVKWPDGHTSVVQNPAADKYLTVTEQVR